MNLRDAREAAGQFTRYDGGKKVGIMRMRLDLLAELLNLPKDVVITAINDDQCNGEASLRLEGAGLPESAYTPPGEPYKSIEPQYRVTTHRHDHIDLQELRVRDV